MTHIGFSRLVFILTTTAVVFAQGPMAPRETVATNINGKKVTIEYGRPSLKNRKIEDLLAQLPSDRMWRAGANQVTTLTTETNLTIGGKRVPAGKYSLYVHAPQSGDWSLAINSDPGIELVKIFPKAPPSVAHALWPRLDGYQKNIADKEVARVAMKAGTVASPVDLFTITLTPVKKQAVVKMSWGNRSWSVDVKAAK